MKVEEQVKSLLLTNVYFWEIVNLFLPSFVLFILLKNVTFDYQIIRQYVIGKWFNKVMKGMEAWKQKKCSITTLHSTKSEQKRLVLTYYDSNCKEHCNYCGFMFYILPSLLKENHNDCNKPDIVYKSKCFLGLFSFLFS